MNKIVYLQTNEKVAVSFQEEFKKHDIEMLIVESGEEALDIISKEKVLLLLLDINIPDMRFRKLVDRIRAISPQIIINVCIDVLDPLMITKLSNRHHVHKIYMAPWDVDEIIEEVKESIEIAIINEQVNIREERINSEVEELNKTVESLKDTLRKQQRSYSKFIGLTDCFMNGLIKDQPEESDESKKAEFVKDIYEALLRMQTTGSFDIDKFESSIKNDLQELIRIAPSYGTGIIESCLFAGQSRAYAQNIRFVIYMIGRLFAQFYDDFFLSVSSHFITTQEAEFIIEVTVEGGMTFGDENAFDDYQEFVNKIITDMTDERRVRKDGNTTTYYCNFPVSRG